MQTGDFLVISGRENQTALQNWGNIAGYNPSVLMINEVCGSESITVGVPGASSTSVTSRNGTDTFVYSGVFSEVLIFTAVGTGHVNLSVDLMWGGIVVRTVYLDVYVNQQPALAMACPRHCDSYEYTNKGN